ncbi:MAG: hypothetical protein KatS3mg097_004 [Candidatus Parcubacteria bacterium]|nr:MAG: hypothetical protein KatS3mg097_004 [Candidatus Parcubacteria bacterium]
MQKYKIFTKDPIKSIESIILHNVASLLPTEIIRSNPIPLIVYKGLDLLRKKGEEGKELYELFHGCILACFLNEIEPDFQHYVCYPEDQSYDFLILKCHKNQNISINISPDTELYQEAAIFKVELTELVQLEDLEKIINNKSKYTKRILLISIAFKGELNFREVFNRASMANKNNFETIWLIGQINHPQDASRLCYFVAELVKHKKVFPLFELLIDWAKIKREAERTSPIK